MHLKKPDNKIFYKAVIFSLLLHVLVIIFFTKYRVLQEAPVETANLNKNRIQLVLFEKKQTLPVVPEDFIEELDNSEDSEQLSINPGLALEDASQTIPQTETPTDTLPPTEVFEGTTSDNKTNRVISTSQLRQMIDSQMSSYNKDLTQQFVEACLIYQNRHGVKECPNKFTENTSIGKLAITNLFNDYGNKFDKEVFIQKYENENKQLATIIENGDSLSRELAKVRYAINLENSLYLQDVFIGDPAGSNKFCGTMPCVFRYSEFTIVQPEREVDPPAAGVKATWFNSVR